MEYLEVKKSVAYTIVEIIGYAPKSVVVKSIMKKATGNINAVSFDIGEKRAEKTFPFDTFIQIIDGRAELLIDGISTSLNTGQSIIIPAHTLYVLNARERFKMISTIIKSGYED